MYPLWVFLLSRSENVLFFIFFSFLGVSFEPVRKCPYSFRTPTVGTRVSITTEFRLRGVFFFPQDSDRGYTCVDYYRISDCGAVHLNPGSENFLTPSGLRPWSAMLSVEGVGQVSFACVLVSFGYVLGLFCLDVQRYAQCSIPIYQYPIFGYVLGLFWLCTRSLLPRCICSVFNTNISVSNTNMYISIQYPECRQREGETERKRERERGREGGRERYSSSLTTEGPASAV